MDEWYESLYFPGCYSIAENSDPNSQQCYNNQENTMIRTIHPFPARMAPELALKSLKRLVPGSVVLDPMSGSGTVIRQAAELGLRPIGFDMDPLAVLMSRVWTKFVDDELIVQLANSIMENA